MLLYCDNNTKEYEKNGQWMKCIEYLYDKWQINNYDRSLFLKLSINTWYALIMDGCLFNLTNEEKERLNEKLLNLFGFFEISFRDDSNCQWMFGYMIEIGTHLFLSYNNENIEEEGKKLIIESAKSGNLIAEYLLKNEKCNKREFLDLRKK